jgi:2-polyprenyl-3-methyl-5-hydroxy-6-metoxy-1,4-benzoquinol methylase
LQNNYKFIERYDDTAGLINEKANTLYQKLLSLDISHTDIDDFGKYYFTNHHSGKRLIFSIESSANIIYNSVKQIKKPLEETSFIDYGAGLGTLFLLAGMVGFKKIYFNDYFPQWADYAKIICDKLDIRIDGFINGDIEAVIDYSTANNIHLDIVASRNVVEHIYNLRNFYTKLYQSGITTLCYSTTTANYHNLAMRLKHYWYHKQVEKTQYIKQRSYFIKEQIPSISDTDLQALIKITRGRAFADITNAIDLYFKKQPMPAVEFLNTNTCDCTTGVWAENLITRQNYSDIIRQSGFTFDYTPGFWDTHYKYDIVNIITRLLNRIIKITGKKGYWFAPFVNISASKN